MKNILALLLLVISTSLVAQKPQRLFLTKYEETPNNWRTLHGEVTISENYVYFFDLEEDQFYIFEIGNVSGNKTETDGGTVFSYRNINAYLSSDMKRYVADIHFSIMPELKGNMGIFIYWHLNGASHHYIARFID